MRCCGYGDTLKPGWPASISAANPTAMPALNLSANNETNPLPARLAGFKNYGLDSDAGRVEN